MKKISFPGLGIDKGFNIDPVAFKIGSFEIRWYAVIICVGIILAFIYFYRRAKFRENLLEDDVLNVTLLAVPIAIIGARFLYVITNLKEYDTFLQAVNIREGGLAIYGAIIFGALTLLVYTRVRRLPALKFFDAISPAVMIGQVIGRWGNFVNGEAYGEGFGADKLPWRMVIEDRGTLINTHPTFFYESLWNLIGFIVINAIYRKKKFDGQIFLLYVAWYGFGRGFVEILRSDSLLVFGQKLMVYLGFISCAAAIAFYVLLSKRGKKDEDAVEDFIREKAAAAEAAAGLQTPQFETETEPEEETTEPEAETTEPEPEAETPEPEAETTEPENHEAAEASPPEGEGKAEDKGEGAQ